MEIRFENKVAFITGAAGGIGYAAARMFADAGASVVMADLDSRVTDRAKELEAEGHNAIGIRCDVSDEAQVKAAVEKAVAVFGKLDIAYNNVGIHAAVREDLEAKGYAFVSAEIEMVPDVYTAIEDPALALKMEKLLDALEDNDDVQAVWHNWDRPDEDE